MKNPAEKTTVRPNQNPKTIFRRRTKPIRATAAKEVGMKDPAEKTTVRPNQNRQNSFIVLAIIAESIRASKRPAVLRMTLNEQMTQLARQAKAASRELAKLTTAEKNACLLAMAAALEQNAAAIKGGQRARHGRRREIRPFIRHARPAQARRQTHRRRWRKVCAKSRRCPIRWEESWTSASGPTA
jgi:hypothetical protein